MRRLALTFTGSQVVVRGDVGSDRGLFEVSIDGGAAEVFDSYGWSDVADAVLWTSPQLAEGSHVVRVTALGDHQLRSTADDIVITGFDVIRTKAQDRCIDGTGTVRVSSLTPFSTWGAANLADGVLTSTPSSLGWHSGLGVYTDDAGECAIVDRGASTAIDSVTLYRADPGSPYPNGLGFPVDYHIDISDDPDFGTFTTVATVTGAPIPSSGNVTHTLTGTPSARYVRLVVTKARGIYSGQFAVALAELGITGATELAGLESWYTALEEKDTRRLNVLVIGDSISESTYNAIGDRYMNLLQERINDEYGLPNAEFTYIPSYYATPVAPVAAPVSWAGTLTPVNFGLGLRATETDSARHQHVHIQRHAGPDRLHASADGGNRPDRGRRWLAGHDRHLDGHDRGVGLGVGLRCPQRRQPHDHGVEGYVKLGRREALAGRRLRRGR